LLVWRYSSDRALKEPHRLTDTDTMLHLSLRSVRIDQV
jgi:hypothetical protein